MCQNNCQCALLFAFDTIRPTVNVASCLCVRLSCRVAFGRNGLQARVVLVRATACVCVRERVVIGKHNSSEEKNKVRKPHPFGPGLTEGFHRGAASGVSTSIARCSKECFCEVLRRKRKKSDQQRIDFALRVWESGKCYQSKRG